MAVDIYQSLWQEFAIESGEHLDRLEPLLVAIEADPPLGGVSKEQIATLFRGMHSIKGMAAALTLKGMERVSHHAEHLLGQVRDGRCALDAAMAGLLLLAVDELKRLRELSVRDRADSPASEAVMARLEAARGSLEGVNIRGGGDKAGDLGFGAAVAAARAVADDRERPVHPDRAALCRYVEAIRPHLPQLARMAGAELEEAPVRASVRLALESVREGARTLDFPQVARTADALAALIPSEGRLDYFAREQAIDALAVLRREVATLEAATGVDGGGKDLDEALNVALSLDFNARRRALLEVLSRSEREPEAFAAHGAAVVRASELAGDIYNHFSFLYNANAGKLLLMIEDVLGHAARGDLVLTPDLLALLRKTLADLAPAPGKPLRDPDPARTAEALAAFEPVVRAAEALAGTAAEGSGGDETAVAAGQYLAELGVTPDLLHRLSQPQLCEAAEAVAGGGARLWEIVASLEESEDRAERFAQWLERHGTALTSRAVPGSTSLSFEFLVLITADDTAVLAGLAGIDPEGRMLSARRCGAPIAPAAPASPAGPFPSVELTVPPPPPVQFEAPPPAEAHPCAAQAPSATATASTTAAGGNVLRVPGEVVDHFLSVIGEMVMVGSMLDDAIWGDDHRSRLPLDLRRLAKEMRGRGEVDPAHLETLARHAAAQEQRDRELRKARERLAATLGRLQEAALELRVVPVETVFARLPRLARDLASGHGKQVRVEVDGRGVRIDKGMVDQLLDPLIHMVRNAVDHGIETPGERTAAGKPPTATLAVRAGQRENRVVIEVTDDGRGLDAEAIRLRAVQRGLVGEATSRLMREDDLHRLILAPGFSTADAITETSGRGVGMDVVHTSVNRLGGAIDIRSEIGQGTTFTLRLPLSAAIQDVLLVDVDARLYAIPVRHLLELTRSRSDQIQTVHGRRVMLLHGALLPVHRLTGLLEGREGALPAGELPIVVLGDGRRRLGLQVDRVVRRQELFVRDIHPRVAAIPGIGGAALLGDGKVVLIVDGGDLFQLAEAREHGAPVPTPRRLAVEPAA
ncbi:MAG: ATP-binding protein [Rhodospirillaceae bacterium]